MNKSIKRFGYLVACVLLFGSLQAGAAEVGVLQVEQGTHKLLRASGGVSRVAVGAPDIADVTVVNLNDVLVVGKKFGLTSLMIWTKKGGAPLEYRVRVVAAKDPARKTLPDAELGEAVVDEGRGLEGKLPNLLAHRRAKIATQPTKEGEVSDRSDVNLETQVLTEVKIAEVSRSTAQRFGINLFKNTANTLAGIANPGSFGGVSGANGQTLLSSSGFLPFQQAYSLVVGNPDKGLIGLLSVLEGRGLARTLAEPSLVATSGQTATYLAGGEFPIPVVQSGASSGGVTVDYKEFGVRLSLTPTVLARDRISLKVAPEVSDLDFSAGITSGGVSVPALLVRRTDTTIELGDGESFVISGLVSSNLVKNVDKVPWLGNVPVLGAFFRSNSLTRTDKELIMIVTPHLVRPLAKEARLPTLPGAKYDNYRPTTGQLIFGDTIGDSEAGFSR